MTAKFSSGVVLALGAALISGLANFLNKVAVTAAPDPVFYTFLKNGLVAVALLSVMVLAARWRECKGLGRADWLKLIAIGVIGGSLPFILFFTGLSLTSAVSASLIHKTLFVWVVLLAVPFLEERLGRIQWAALGLLLFGNLLLGGWQQLSWGAGELMILAATILWAVENVIAKKALKNLSSTLVASARMSLGSLVLLAVVWWQGNISLVGQLSLQQWGWSVLASVLLFGYVLSWYAALKRAPAAIVASLLVPASLVTSLLSLVFLDKALPTNELGYLIVTAIALTLMIIGYRFNAGLQLKPR